MNTIKLLSATVLTAAGLLGCAAEPALDLDTGCEGCDIESGMLAVEHIAAVVCEPSSAAFYCEGDGYTAGTVNLHTGPSVVADSQTVAAAELERGIVLYPDSAYLPGSSIGVSITEGSYYWYDNLIDFESAAVSDESGMVAVEPPFVLWDLLVIDNGYDGAILSSLLGSEDERELIRTPIYERSNRIQIPVASDATSIHVFLDNSGAQPATISGPAVLIVDDVDGQPGLRVATDEDLKFE